MNEAEPLDEETIIRILWGGFGKTSRDPFDDDAAWLSNQRGKKYLVGKADMFVAETDAPPQMSPQQIAEKSILACVSDLAAKGVSPKGPSHFFRATQADGDGEFCDFARQGFCAGRS